MANGAGKVDHPHKGVQPGGKEKELSPKEVGPHDHRQKTDHFHWDAGKGRWMAHGQFDHGKGPEAWLGRFLFGLKQRAGLVEKPDKGQPPERNRVESGPKGGKDPATLKAEKLKIQPQQLQEQMQRSDRKGTSELTPFERVLLARFVETRPLWSPLKTGQSQFRAKSDGEWKGFFQKFLPFTLEKKARTAEVESLIYRGMVRGDTGKTLTLAQARRAQEIALLISDLKFVTGKTEKFARIPLSDGAQLATALARLASLKPGEVLNQTLLAQWLGGEFPFLALAPKIVQPDLAQAMANPLVDSARGREGEGAVTGRQPTQGIALAARTEELIARQLEIDLRRPIPQSGPARETAGGGEEVGRKWFGGLSRRRRRGQGGEGILQEGFVPWYRLIFEGRRWRGKVKWYVPLLYLVVASATALFGFYVFRYLLQR